MKKWFSRGLSLLVILAITVSMATLASCSDGGIIAKEVKQLNAECPQTIADGLEIKGVLIKGKKVVYHLTIDESKLDYKRYKENVPKIKEQVIRDIAIKARSGMGSFYKALAMEDYTLVYRYKGSKCEERFNVEITPDQLKMITRRL